MIKVQELRIGNLLEDHGEYLPVGFDTFKDWVEFNFGEILKEIPISTEWLLKFGFAESNLIGYEHFKLNIQPRFITKRFLNGGRIENPFLRFDGLVDIYYVHQLQNLYFALTGEELSVETVGS